MASPKEMRDRITKLEQEVETFRRDMDLDDDKETTHLKSSYLFGDSRPFSTPRLPAKPLTVSSIHNGGSGTVTKPSVIKAVPFKGAESEDFLLWLQNYEQISRVNDYKVLHIATVLQEDANRKYWECSDLARSSWVLLKEALN